MLGIEEPSRHQGRDGAIARMPELKAAIAARIAEIDAFTINVLSWLDHQFS
jgi:hypothetical protein